MNKTGYKEKFYQSLPDIFLGDENWRASFALMNQSLGTEHSLLTKRDSIDTKIHLQTPDPRDDVWVCGYGDDGEKLDYVLNHKKHDTLGEFEHYSMIASPILVGSRVFDSLDPGLKEWHRQFGIDGMGAVALHRERDGSYYVLNTHYAEQDVDPAHIIKLMDEYKSVLSKYILVEEKIYLGKAKKRIEDQLRQSRFPQTLLSPRGNILYTNALLEKTLSMGSFVSSKYSKLIFLTPHIQAKFEAAFKEVLNLREPQFVHEVCGQSGEMVTLAITPWERAPARYLQPELNILVTLLRNDVDKYILLKFSLQEGLTERHAQIFALALEDCSQDQIALRLDISRDTLKKHLQKAYQQLHIEGASQGKYARLLSILQKTVNFSS